MPAGHLKAFMAIADECRHIDTTAEHVRGMLEAADLDVAVALWPDLRAPSGVNAWVIKGRPILEAVVDRDKQAPLAMTAFWLRDREHAVAIYKQVDETKSRTRFSK